MSDNKVKVRLRGGFSFQHGKELYHGETHNQPELTITKEEYKATPQKFDLLNDGNSKGGKKKGDPDTQNKQLDDNKTKNKAKQ